MPGIPDRPELFRNLRTLSHIARARTDDTSLGVGLEIVLGLTALTRADAAQTSGDHLGTLIYLRLLAEAALRVRWVGGDTDEAGADGYPLVDAAVVRERLIGLRRRDLIHMAGALKVTAEYAGTDPAPLLKELGDRIAELKAPPAPAKWRGFATSHSAGAAYSAHRMCSSVVHAGTAMPGALKKENQRLPEMIDGCAFLIVSWGASILEVLAQ